MGDILAGVADAVVEEVETALHVIVHVVVGNPRQAALDRPVPGEALGGGGNVGNDGVYAVAHDSVGPLRAVPCFERVALEFVGDAIQIGLGLRHERVARRRAVGAARQVAAKPFDCRCNYKVSGGRRGAPEEANLVHRAVPLEFRVGKRTVVYASGLADAVKAAGRVSLSVAVSAAEREGSCAHRPAHVCRQIRRHRLEERTFRAVGKSRDVLAFPPLEAVYAHMRAIHLETHAGFAAVVLVVVHREVV